MPRTNTKRARRNMRSGNKRSSLTTTSLIGGVPDRMRVQLSYATSVSIVPSGVTAGNYVFTGNDPYDPDVTSTGLQPANYDDFSLLYLRYRVWGSTLHWKIANKADATNEMSTIVVGPRHTSAGITTQTAQNNFAAQPYTKVQKSVIYGNGFPSMSGSMSMSTQKYLGMSKSSFQGETELTALVTASPAHRWFWQICISVDDQSSAITHYVHAIITYDIEFYDRVDTTLDLATRVMSLRRSKFERDLKDQAEGLKDDEQIVVVNLPTPSGSAPHVIPAHPAGSTPRLPPDSTLVSVITQDDIKSNGIDVLSGWRPNSRRR